MSRDPNPGWSVCLRGHRHVDQSPTVMALLVDVGGHALLERAQPDQPFTWTLPAAPLQPAQRTSTCAARLVAGLLGISTFDVQVRDPIYTDACEQGGLHLRQLLLTGQAPSPSDDNLSWIRAEDGDDLDIDPAVDAFTGAAHVDETYPPGPSATGIAHEAAVAQASPPWPGG